MANKSTFDFAVSNMKMVNHLVLTTTGDDYELNVMGFMLHKVVELALRHIIESNDATPTQTPDICVLLRQLDNIGALCVIEPELCLDLIRFAGNYTLWEEKGGSDSDWHLTFIEMREGFVLANRLLLAVAKLGKYPYQSIELPHALRPDGDRRKGKDKGCTKIILLGPLFDAT